jgi:GAF domain-containing protein
VTQHQPQPQPSNDPSGVLARLATINFATSDLEGVLRIIAGLAQEAVNPATAVSVTLVRQGKGLTAAFAGDLAMALDEQQYDQGYGPCLDACDSGEMLMMEDTATERRWPSFARRAEGLGVRSSLSVPLPVQDDVTGALNLYALTPGAFDGDARHAATTFADHAAVAVSNARSYDAVTTFIARMRTAAATRSAIDQAKGVVIGRHGISREEALTVLILTARQTGERLGDVAATLVSAVQTDTPSPAEANLLAVVDTITGGR